LMTFSTRFSGYWVADLEFHKVLICQGHPTLLQYKQQIGVEA